MNLDNYTQKSQEALLAAQRLAQDYNHQTIEPAHLLLALLKQEGGVVAAIVTKVAGSPLALRQEIEQLYYENCCQSFVSRMCGFELGVLSETKVKRRLRIIGFGIDSTATKN